MTHSFNQMEGIKIAVEMERSGARFYESASSLVQDEIMKATLMRLAAMEREHEKIFLKIHQEVASGGAPYDGERSALLAAIAASVVFPGGVMAQAMNRQLGSERDILLTAIHSEKDAILFYQELRAHAATEEAKQTFARLIQEEERHLIELSGLLEGSAE